MNKTDIKKRLSELGLKNGDVVIVHSSLASIGYVEGGADALLDAFLETIGSEGTLTAPVFGNLGIFTHTLKNRPEALISDCPLGTVAAIGAGTLNLSVEIIGKPRLPTGATHLI